MTSSASPARASLGDFTIGSDALRIVLLAVPAGAIATAIALVLLDLIGLVTNVAYYGRLSVALVSPPEHGLAPWTVAIPVAGGLVIGVMARFGSERIRGHGIPEAMETILVGGSRVEPRLAVLKPISSAISIGTGGPFGAEGPIILTGGAFGSLVGQLFHLSAAERKTLLVAGAAAGMTAVFGTPVASVLLAVELLLFEWKPRSMLPVVTAVVVAAALRIPLADGGLIAAAPLFPVPAHGAMGDTALASAFLVGIAGGLIAWLLTVAVYGAEDLFKRLPVHWMWWPVIGGMVIGLGGLAEPRALGVGYDSIRAELAGQLATGALLSLLVVKLVIWSLALGSGTSGGILAPLLLMGGAVGGLMAPWLPGGTPAVWAMLGMAAALAGVTRSPFTGIVFALELTRDQDALLPLLIACVVAYGMSALVLRRSILTEKVARRGFHVMREYQVDPLEALFTRDVMATSVLTVEPSRPAAEVRRQLLASPTERHQRLLPVLGGDGRLLGVVGRRELTEQAEGMDGDAVTIGELMRDPVVAYGDETLRAVADRMAAMRVGMMPVVERDDPARLLGLISQFDLLRARERLLTEERHRERMLRPRFMPRIRRAAAADAADG